MDSTQASDATSFSTTTPPSPMVLWPVSSESVWSRARNGVVLSTAGGMAIGSVMGLFRDSSPGVYSFSTGLNTALGTSAWFALREFVVSPTLLKCGLTEEARRRYDGVLLERGLRGRALDDPAWLTVRTDRIADSAITGALFFATAPPLYQEFKARVTTMKPVRNPLSFTLGSALAAGVGSAFLQWVCNELRIHDLKKYGAWDAFGPMPTVDITAVRLAQRRQLVESVQSDAVHPAVRARQRKEEKACEEAAQRERDGNLTPSELVRRRRPAWSWSRFVNEAVPVLRNVPPQEMLDLLQDDVDKWEEELAAVRTSMREMRIPTAADDGLGNERRIGAVSPPTPTEWQVKAAPLT